MNRKINRKILQRARVTAVLAGVLMALGSVGAHATDAIDGISGPTFNFTAKVDHISTADGGSVMLWGYADDDNQAGFGTRAQYPAPTLIVNKGDTITINLKNGLSVAAGDIPNVSIVFPGQDVMTSCTDGTLDTCPQGALTMEAGTDGDVVSYTFTATHAGTYLYHSGTNPGLQVEMGLTGALIVRPGTPFQAYEHPDTAYGEDGHELLFFLSEMDPRIHQEVEFNGPDTPELQALLDNYVANYWFINGRTAPDNFSDTYVNWLPTQPYNSVPRMHAGDKLLMRVVGGGRDMHPFHHHGEHARIIAVDGRMLESSPGAGPDLATSVFTTKSIPGKTSDGIFEWSGAGLNWDIYGGTDVNMPHTCNGKAVGEAQDPGAADFDSVSHEYCADHGKPFPVALPEKLDLAFGGWWSGSPYLGSLGALPPGEGGLNPNGGFSFMWHSHTEKELANYDIFPGGMMTMMIIESYNVIID